MDYVGFVLGDGTNQATLNLKVLNMDIRWDVFENRYRTINGDLNRQVVKGLIPTVNVDFGAISETVLGILKGARAQKQEMYLRVGDQKVVRQYETMFTASTFYLMASAVSGITAMTVYTKADFAGTSNLFSAFDSTTRLVTITGAHAVGSGVYVNYTYQWLKVICTALSSRPYRGASKSFWQASATFEGI